MYCKNCGAQMADGMKFCTVCGAPLESGGVDLNKDSGASNGYGNSWGQGYGQQQNFYGGYGQQQGGYGYGQPMGDPYGIGMGGGFGIQERSIAMCIILTFLTCGFYSLYWLYNITEETNRFSGDPNPTTGGMAILYGILSCGIYYIYWYYKRGEIIDNYMASRGYPPQSNAVLYLVLSLFGLGLVSMSLMQSELNKIARGM